MAQFEERRSFERFQINCKGYILKDDSEINVEIMNMSGQGLGFRTDAFLDNGEEISIHLEVQGEPEPVTLFGIVIRSELLDSSLYEIGFKLDLTSWMKVSKFLGEK